MLGFSGLETGNANLASVVILVDLGGGATIQTMNRHMWYTVRLVGAPTIILPMRGSMLMESPPTNQPPFLIKTPEGIRSPTFLGASPSQSPIIRYQYLSLGDRDIDLKVVVNLNRYGEVEVGLSSPEAYLGTIRLSLQDDLLEVFADAVELSVGIFTRLVEDILGNETMSNAPSQPDEDTQTISPYNNSSRTEVSGWETPYGIETDWTP